MVEKIQSYRAKHPEFNSMSDEALGDVLFKTYYEPEGMPRAEFDSQFGLSQRIGTGEDVLRSIATGAGEAVHAVPGMIGGLVGAGMQLGRGIDKYILGNEVKDPAEVAAGNPLQAITPEAFEHYSGFEDIKHQPQTTAGEIARTGAQFITPVLPLGAAAAIRAGRVIPGARAGAKTVTTLGVAPAVASEGAKRGAKEYAPGWEDAAAVLGGLVGGGVMAVISRPSNAAVVIKNAMPRGVTNADIMRADALVQRARQSGVTLTWPEALSQATNGRVDITGLQRIVEQTRGGGPIMTTAISERAPQMRAATGEAMENIIPRAQMVDPTVAGQTIQRTAQDEIRNINQLITRATEPYYRRAANTRVPPAPFMQTESYQRALQAVRRDPVHAEFVQGLPDDSIGVLNEVKKYFDRQVEQARDTQAAGFYGNRARQTREAGVAQSQDYERALGLQTELRRQLLNPEEAGPLGALSRTDKIKNQAQAVINETAEGSEQRIGQTIRLLSDRSPDAALQLLRTHIRGVFDAASGSNLDQWRGGKFAAAIRGNPQEAANLEAAIRALPDGDARWEGLNAFIDVMEATGRRARPNSTTAFSSQTMREMERGGIPGEAIAISRSLGGRVMDFYKEWNLGNVSEAMARMMTDPRNAGMWRNLAAQRTPAGKRAVAGYLIAYYGGQQSGTVQPLNMEVTGQLTQPGLKPSRDASGRVTGFTPGQ